MIRIVLGYIEESRESTPDVLYCGHDATAAQQAVDAADPDFLRVEIADVPAARRARQSGDAAEVRSRTRYSYAQLREAHTVSLEVIAALRAENAKLQEHSLEVIAALRAENAKLKEHFTATTPNKSDVVGVATTPEATILPAPPASEPAATVGTLPVAATASDADETTLPGLGKKKTKL
jgi:cell division septation protein DedD